MLPSIAYHHSSNRHCNLVLQLMVGIGIGSADAIRSSVQ
jgi:hypothetical protein